MQYSDLQLVRTIPDDEPSIRTVVVRASRLLLLYSAIALYGAISAFALAAIGPSAGLFVVLLPLLLAAIKPYHSLFYRMTVNRGRTAPMRKDEPRPDTSETSQSERLIKPNAPLTEIQRGDAAPAISTRRLRSGDAATIALRQFEEEPFEAIYAQYFDYLVRIAVHKFRIPDSDAEMLATDVLVAFLQKQDVVDPRPWLVSGICHASRHYWRLNAGTTHLPDIEAELDRADAPSLRILDAIPDQIAVREALECLDPRCREILLMRYFEGCTVSEVAERLGLKEKYAQKLIAKCLRRAEMLYREKEKEP